MQRAQQIWVASAGRGTQWDLAAERRKGRASAVAVEEEEVVEEVVVASKRLRNARLEEDLETDPRRWPRGGLERTHAEPAGPKPVRACLYHKHPPLFKAHELHLYGLSFLEIPEHTFRH